MIIGMVTANSNDIHIGKLVKSVFLESDMTITELADHLNCDRTNIYTIFRRRTIDVEMLSKLSVALQHNFLEDAMKLYGLTPTSSPTLNISLRLDDTSSENLKCLMDYIEKFNKQL